MNFDTYCRLAVDAFRLYGFEILGAFLLGGLISLPYVKKTMRESFVFLSAGFYTLVARDMILIGLTLWPFFFPKYPLISEVVEWTKIGLTSLVASLFVVGSLKNMRLYFSAVFFIPILIALLGGIGIGVPFLTVYPDFFEQLPSIYLALSFVLVGTSFYAAPQTNKLDTVRGMGAGFLVLSLCYIYLLMQLISNSSFAILACYVIAIILSLISQIQFFNVRIAKLEIELQKENNLRQELWDISPFPIIISRIRDDAVLYLNPTAQRAFQLKNGEIFAYRLRDYFVNSEDRQEMANKIQHDKVLSSFVVQMHHPKREEILWMDISARPLELDEDVALYSTFKDVTDRQRMTELLKTQASTDPLTSLNNRRQFEVVVHQLLRLAKRYGTPYSVAMIDIDSFKSFNDTYGHDVGDRVLIELAKTLKKTVRQSDVVARFGGEEFVVFFAQTTPEDAKTPAEHIRQAVENMIIEVDDKRIPVTISLGISGKGENDLETLIKQADIALYYSKQHGKNQVSLYDLITDTQGDKQDVIQKEGPKETTLISDGKDVTPAKDN